MTLNEQLLGQIFDACRGHIYLVYISPMKRFNFLVMRTNLQKKVGNFQRNLTFQIETNVSPREGYLQKKIACKFDEDNWSSFLLRALLLKIFLHTVTAAAMYRMLNQRIHWMYLVDMIILKWKHGKLTGIMLFTLNLIVCDLCGRPEARGQQIYGQV